MKLACLLIVLLALCASVQSGRTCANGVPEKLWEKVLLIVFGLIFMVGFLVAAAIQKTVEFFGHKKKLEKFSRKWNISQDGKDFGKCLMGFTIVLVSCVVTYKSYTTPNQIDIENKIKDNAKNRETQKTACELLKENCLISISGNAFGKPSNSETEEEKKERKKRKRGCKILVRDLPVNHPIFIEFSDVIIPKRGVMQFLINEHFEVNCVQSKFSNGGASKNIKCIGNDEYQIDGDSRIVDVSAFNRCIKRIELTQVDGAYCPGGVMKHMGFQMPAVGFFELYTSCYNMKTSSTIYGRYLLYDGGNIERFASSFKEAFSGKNGIDELYIRSGYQRGHLMPYADRIFPAWRKETNYFINAKPQIGSLNVGAWRILESAIRKEAIVLMQTLEVYTGAFDLIRHLSEDLQLIEVHKFWYKIVKGTERWMDMRGNAGIVFVACNDADSSCNVELSKICQNICKATGWLVTAPTARLAAHWMTFITVEKLLKYLKQKESLK
ncbi:unnamed protein product [Diamesa tonsa]